MSKTLSFIALLISISYLFSNTLTVNQNGQGNYTSIQSAINSSVNGDVVLVYPGRYYENIDFMGKNITVASLKYTTNDPAYIGTTIIDGQQQGSCVVVGGNITSSRLVGFSITNGSGDNDFYSVCGGGILVNQYSTISIESCHIFGNKALHGGGLYAWRATITLSDTNVYENLAIYGGGGICLEGDAVNLIMDSIDRCSIYNNYAGHGTDLLAMEVPYTIPVVVDTFTVIHPDRYYADTQTQFVQDIYGFSYDIQHGLFTHVSHDLFVAPNGNDQNDGLSQNTPLRTIARALLTIKSDKRNPKTVHLASGVYSESLNGQILPLSAKAYVHLQGSGMGDTIIDGDSTNMCLVSNKSNEGFVFSDLTFRNFHGRELSSPIDIAFTTKLTFENIKVTGCSSKHNTAIYAYDCDNLHFKNVVIKDNIAAQYSPGIVLGHTKNSTIENCSFINNNALGIGEFDFGYQGGALYIEAEDSILIRNCLFEDNSDYLERGGSALTMSSLYSYKPYYRVENCLFSRNESTNQSELRNYPINLRCGKSDLINCTFVDNVSTCCTLIIEADSVNFVNCIFADNSAYEMELYNQFIDPPGSVSFDHCDIRNGLADIFNVADEGVITFLEGNIQAVPLFNNGSPDSPYELTENSPCIDAGTLNVSGKIYPYDLNGAPRVHGNGIDMGCYEYGSEPVGNEEDLHTEVCDTRLFNYPNPFNPYTRIQFSILKEGRVTLDIYNIKGQKVKTLTDQNYRKGTYEVTWNGKDKDGNKVASGLYTYRMNSNGQSITHKMLLLK